MCGEDIQLKMRSYFGSTYNNTGGKKWTVVFECCSRHSSKGNAVNEKKSILKMNLLHYGGKVARKALT